jgi:hypothetical protein
MNKLRKAVYARANDATVNALAGGGLHYQAGPAPNPDDPQGHYPYIVFEFVGPSRPDFAAKSDVPAVEKFLLRFHCYAVDSPEGFSGAERGEAMAEAVVERFKGDDGRRLQLGDGRVAEMIYGGQFPLPVDGPGYTISHQVVEFKAEVLRQ